MDTPALHLRLASLVAERSRDELGLEGEGADALIATLCEHSVDAGLAEAIVWGYPAEASADAVELIAGLLALEPNLLSCLLQPTSEELVEHQLVVAQKHFCPEGCGYCDDMSGRLGELLSGDLDEDQRESARDLLVIDALEHVRLSVIAEPDRVPSDGGVWLCDETLDLDDILQGLPVDARRRVLAFAQSEAEQASASRLSREAGVVGHNPRSSTRALSR